MIYNEANLKVCREALYLLRQDFGLPSVADAASDTSLEWQKCQTAFDNAIAEVWRAHDWTVTPQDTAATDTTNWTVAMRAALAYCVATELAIPLAGRIQDLQNWRTLYGQKLARARALALEDERATIEDNIHKDIIALLVPRFDPSDGHLPRSLKTITRRADDLASGARAHILSSYAWNFARSQMDVPACHTPCSEVPYAYRSEVPADAIHLEAVYTHGGSLNDWKVGDGRIILSRYPTTSVVYTRDDRRPDRWPPLVRRAYIYRLSADTAMTEMPELLQALEMKAQAALAEAKTRDAREGSAPVEAWGPNYLTDAMKGRRPGFIRPDRPDCRRIY